MYLEFLCLEETGKIVGNINKKKEKRKIQYIYITVCDECFLRSKAAPQVFMSGTNTELKSASKIKDEPVTKM